MADVLHQDVALLAVRGEREAYFRAFDRRTNRKEVDALPAEIHSPEDEEPPLLHAVFDGEQAREVAGLVVAFIHGVQLKPAEPGLVRKREVPRIDLLQACRVVNQHFTSPGDDYDCGTPARYEIVTSDNHITPRNFSNADPLGNRPDPVKGGKQVTYNPPAHKRFVAVRATMTMTRCCGSTSKASARTLLLP